MKYSLPLSSALLFLVLCSCAMYETKQEPSSSVAVPKPLTVPVGKNWQVIEEAPELTNERTNRLPFQTEESIEPEGLKGAPPAEKGKIETGR